MPTFASLTILDGKATPASHVFDPIRNPAGSAEFAEASSDGALTARNQLNITQKLPGRGRSTVLNEISLVMPYVVQETVNGVTRNVVHSNVRFVGSVICDPAVPEAVRKDARALGAKALLHASIAEAFDKVVAFS